MEKETSGRPRQRQRHVGFTIKALNNQIKRHLDTRENFQREKKHTGMQFGVLGFITHRTENGQDVFQKDVEAEFNIRRSTATGILQLMEKNGLLRREPVEHDARLKKLVLTPEAIELHSRVREEMDDMEATITRGISKAELEAFYATVDKMMKNLSE